MMNLYDIPLKKEKSHAYLDHCNSAHTMATRILRAEYLNQYSAHRQRCPHTACDRRHSHYLETAGPHIDLCLVEIGCSDRLPLL